MANKTWIIVGGLVVVGATAYFLFKKAPLPPEKAILTIDTAPIKAEVFVDGVSWGIAPQTNEVDAGTYTINFGEFEGYYAPEAIEINLREGEEKQIIGEYVKMPPPGMAYLNVHSTPSDAEVNLDGDIGTTPIINYEVNPGAYILKLVKEEYEEHEEEFTINEGEIKTFDIMLTKLIGSTELVEWYLSDSVGYSRINKAYAGPQ